MTTARKRDKNKLRGERRRRAREEEEQEDDGPPPIDPDVLRRIEEHCFAYSIELNQQISDSWTRLLINKGDIKL